MTMRPGLIAIALVLACTRRPPAPESGTLSGRVAYRERTALPPDAIVQVQLSDVSAQDAAAPVIAETMVEAQGRQVPLPFELHYDPQRIDPARMYAVGATIRSEGQLLFTTTTVTRVLTQGNPSRVDLMLSTVAAQPEEEAGGLVGTTWQLEALGGAPVVDQVRVTLEFPDEGKVVGKGPCNRFFGSVQVSGNTISFGALGSTRMACPESVMQQEAVYFSALQRAERYALQGTSLLISSKGREQPLRFRRTGP